MANIYEHGKSFPLSGICVDGACEGNPGPSEYQGVSIKTRELLFGYKLGIGTNNLAEFIGLVHAIEYCMDPEVFEDTIYTDSMVALWWLLKGKHKTTFTMSEDLARASRKAIIKLMKYKITGNPAEGSLKVLDPSTGNSINVFKWKTKIWGEIPADFGRK